MKELQAECARLKEIHVKTEEILARIDSVGK